MNKFLISIAGNPNSGKTTLFNALTGSTQRVGNWPGVTVEKKEGHFKLGDTEVAVVDLPGIYSLAATSEDERVALDFVLHGKSDLIIDIVDATNLERNLYLTMQLLEMKVPMVVVVNMLDIAEKRGIKIDLDALSAKLGCPVYGTVAINKNSAESLKEKLIEQAAKRPVPNITITYPSYINEWLDAYMHNFKKTAKDIGASERWIALRILENTAPIVEKARLNKELDDKKQAESLSLLLLNHTTDLEITESRYRLIHDIADAVTREKSDKETVSSKVDKVVLNRVLGIPIFLLMMYLVFWATLSIGGAFIDFFDIAFGTIFVDGFGALLDNIGSPAWLTTLLASGIGAGVQTVSTFVPIVFVMFICLALLEDSGYMARAAFVMDRFMRAIGLPGKSFVPMLVGFGCTVPAIMASRTLDTQRDRILTIFMTPFMSCGARLPVYALFGAAFFGARSGLMVFSIYLAGAVLAILTGLLMKNTMLKGQPSYFIMELPPYHAPRAGVILRNAWSRLKTFITRAGKVIVITVAFLGVLNSLGTDGSFGNEDAEKSVLSAIGTTITPIFEPMGIHEDNWPATVSLFTGLFAKEAVVGTLNSLYAQLDATTSAPANELTVEEEPVVSEDGTVEGEVVEEEEAFSLWRGLGEAFATIPENLLGVFGGLLDPFGVGIITGDEESTAEEVGADNSVFTSMRNHFTEGYAQIYAYLLFVLLYVPCMAAMGAVVREIGGKMAIILAVYLTVLAWIVSTLTYQIGYAHNPLWIGVAIVLLICLSVVLSLLGRSKPSKPTAV